jgi:hypothetical protein
MSCDNRGTSKTETLLTSESLPMFKQVQWNVKITEFHENVQLKEEPGTPFGVQIQQLLIVFGYTRVTNGNLECYFGMLGRFEEQNAMYCNNHFYSGL